MPRRVKLPTLEMGDIHLLLIDDWADGWDVLKGTTFGNLISVVSREALDHAMYRLSKPLVSSLGIPPEGALRKVPRQCWQREKRDDKPYPCPLYDKKACQATSPDVPWCFEPDSTPDDSVRKKAAEAIELWKQGVYVVVVKEG